uniref:TIR domain-containing protein n=1 Tax=Quercus lobata TaxID=97700 RepID=A0A7N2LAQ5_QUELO
MEDHNDDAISSSEASRLRWHVFLSFRGEDTRYPFINNLNTSLHNKGIRAFRDDDGLRRGDEIAPTLLDAIEESAASIVVISQNYASSRWCLEELSKICECKRLILPVFYLVDPSDVRKQRGPFFGKHFREHEEKGIEKEKVTKWREAMETAGGKAGFVFQDKDKDRGMRPSGASHSYLQFMSSNSLYLNNNKYSYALKKPVVWHHQSGHLAVVAHRLHSSNEAQAKLIQLLVKRVLEELDSTPLDVAPYTVGLDSRIEKLKSLLDVRSNGVRVLALHGMGGVGKTTLAKALYNKLVGSFECLVFMKNDRENSETDDDLVYLQNKLVNHLSPGKPPVYRIDSGISAIKAMVHEKQVLVILDDIRNVRQLEVLVGRDWFSEGSRIIITTRDSEVFVTTPLQLCRYCPLWGPYPSWFCSSPEAFSPAQPGEEQNHEGYGPQSGHIYTVGVGLLQMRPFPQRNLGKNKTVRGMGSKADNIYTVGVGSLQNTVEAGLLQMRPFSQRNNIYTVGVGLLQVLPKHLVNEFYEVIELAPAEALQLFSYHALRREKPTERFMNLSKKMVSLTGGLPLALEVFGSFLFERWRIEEWKDALQKLERIRPRNLQDVLKISYDGLDVQEQCIFLDLACLFIKKEIEREDILDALKGCGFRAEIAITVLRARSLIKVFEDNSLWMHDQIRDMGRQIVLDESPVYPGMRSRLWDRDEIMTVLKGEKGTRRIEGIVLDFQRRPIVQDASGERISWENLLRTPNFTSALTYAKERYKKFLQDNAEKEREVVLCTKPFESMVNLRLLQINHVRLEGKYKYLPAGLKWLQWKGCPLKALPSEFLPRELSVLDLSESRIEQVWGWYSNNVAEKLMVIKLRNCYNLADIPNLSGHQNLEKLVLEGCCRLTKIHESIGNISTLRHLNMRDCSNLIEFPTDISGLKHLENLVLSGCSKLKRLPNDLRSLKCLKEFLLDETAIEELPTFIYHLTKLEKLSLKRCQFLTTLPECIGHLCSLKELSLNHSAIKEIPDSVGSLSDLEILSLIGCKSFTTIPDSVGNLKSLTELLIYGLGSLVEINLDWTSITQLPNQVGDLKMLRKLEMWNCKNLKFLPESIGSMLALMTLNISNAKISELPESIGMLENLITLRLSNCTQLYKLPASIGNLKSLQRLLMGETAVAELPESFGKLSSLMILEMPKKPYFELPRNSVPNSTVLPTSFSNLCSLKELNARAWKLCGKIPDDFKKLSSLEILNLGHNNFFSLPSSLMDLSKLKKLLLPNCEELKSLPPLPSSLLEVNVADCPALERVSDLSNLESLEELNLTNCEMVVDIPGLECLKSLRRLYMSGCKTCSSVVKRRLSKLKVLLGLGTACSNSVEVALNAKSLIFVVHAVLLIMDVNSSVFFVQFYMLLQLCGAHVTMFPRLIGIDGTKLMVSLRNMFSLSMPGSKIPDWFSQEVVKFSERKNLRIKGVIIGVIVSFSHQIPDNLRDQDPLLTGIRANIVKLNRPVFNAMLDIKGVPKTHEDHLYLSRFPDWHPLSFSLKDDYKIHVTIDDPPYIEGLKLKKWGVHLVFEGDDDYDGNEESLDETQLSISEKLAKFFSFLEEEEDHIPESGFEVESQVQEIEEQEEIEREPHWWQFLWLFRRCFCF